MFRKISKYSEAELQADPSLLKDMGNPEAEQEEILIEEGLGSEYDPAFAVFQKAVEKYAASAEFQTGIAKIERAYQQGSGFIR